MENVIERHAIVYLTLMLGFTFVLPIQGSND